MHSWLVGTKYAVRNAGDATDAETRRGLRPLGNLIHIHQGTASSQQLAGCGISKDKSLKDAPAWQHAIFCKAPVRDRVSFMEKGRDRESSA